MRIRPSRPFVAWSRKGKNADEMRGQFEKSKRNDKAAETRELFIEDMCWKKVINMLSGNTRQNQ